MLKVLSDLNFNNDYLKITNDYLLLTPIGSMIFHSIAYKFIGIYSFILEFIFLYFYLYTYFQLFFQILILKVTFIFCYL